MRLFLGNIGALLLLLLALPAAATAASFSDIPAGHSLFPAVEYLKARNVLSGYDDGTFRAATPVNRAEAIKLIVSLQASSIPQDGYDPRSSFADVPRESWFEPYVMHAYDSLHVIDGPPSTRLFHPHAAVTRAAFLKMLLLSYDTHPEASYAELTFPLAADAADPSAWYYPYLRYALATSMIGPTDGKMLPGEELTRGAIADMLYNFLLYREGKRTQTLLSVAENETLTALRLIESGAAGSAKQAAGRAIVASRGALNVRSGDAAIRASVKMSEAAMALATAAEHVVMEKTISIDAAGTAWHLSEQAKEFSGAFNAIVTQIQQSAAEIADAARLGG